MSRKTRLFLLLLVAFALPMAGCIVEDEDDGDGTTVVEEDDGNGDVFVDEGDEGDDTDVFVDDTENGGSDGTN